MAPPFDLAILLHISRILIPVLNPYHTSVQLGTLPKKLMPFSLVLVKRHFPVAVVYQIPQFSGQQCPESHGIETQSDHCLSAVISVLGYRDLGCGLRAEQSGGTLWTILLPLLLSFIIIPRPNY